MATTYKKNASNVYKIPIYNRFWVWWIVALLVSVALSYVKSWILFSWFPMISMSFWIVVIALTVWKGVAVGSDLIAAKSINRYFSQKHSARAVTRSLLATMAVNRLQDTPYISVPKVKVCDSRPSMIEVEVEKLPGMYDIERITEDINSSFRGKLAGYAVTSGIITNDGLHYKFLLEDVSTDKTWTPKTFDDLFTEKYIIKLQDGLSIRIDERPHIAVWGRTGSKKTTCLYAMVLQYFSMGADVRFIDGKDEFSSFGGFYPEEKIASDINSVFDILDDVLDIVKARQKLMSQAVQSQERLGLKASDVGLRPVVLIADEIGSIVALMDNKEAKRFVSSLVAIIQRGRSVGVSVIASTQDPSTDTLPQKIRQQFSTKILLGSANGDIQRMAFGEVATAGDVEDFRGYYTCDGLTVQPMTFYVPDIYKYQFNNLGAFKRAYLDGQMKDYANYH